MRWKNRFLGRLTASAFLLLMVCPAYNQLLFSENHKRYVIKTLNVENGLSNNSVGDITTDVFGFTWVATKTGLQRYDGYRLETVHPTVGGVPVNTNYQVHFLQTRNHLLWITYHNGILQYNPYRNQFASLIYLPQSATTCPLRPLNETEQGIWCMQDNKLALYNKSGSLVRNVYINNLSVIPPLLSPKFQFAANTRYLFLQTMQNEVMMFNKADGTFASIPFDNKILYNLACTETRLYISHNKGITAINITSGKPSKVTDVFRAEKSAFGTVKVLPNTVVLASINQHLLSLDSNCKNISEITTLGSSPVIPAGYINTIYEDQFSRMWLLTNDDIKIVQNYTIPFQYYAYPNATNFIKSIYVDEAQNRVLAGCFNGGIQLYDTLNRPLWEKPLMNIKTKDIVCIEKLSKDEYFLETLGQGWFILKLSEKKITPMNISAKDEALLHTHTVSFPNNIQRLDSSTLIVINASDVIQCSFTGDKLSHYSVLFHNNGNSLLNYFYLNNNTHRLWVGTNAGTLYCKHSNGNTDTFTIPNSYMVRSITSDAQNNTWVGTDKGLFVYNSNNRIIKTFSSSNGLLNDCIYSLLTNDKKEIIYAGSNLGLSAIKLNGVLKNYTKERGLQENEFNTAAIAKTSSGKLFFGGVNGITAFYPSDVTTEHDHPSLLIYKTEINDKIPISDSAAWNAQAYNLSYDENKISFSLTAFGLQNASAYVYEYKMGGFDKYWTTTSNPTNISYHLPPGSYQFSARVVHSPETTLTRNIQIAYPYWERWWFYLLMAALVFALLLVAARAIFQRRYKVKLQALHIRQQVLAERERISRDLHDNIGAYASAISANVDDVIYQFDASNHVTLQRLKESAREIIIQLRDSIWALNKENQSIIMLSDRIKNYVQKLQPTYPDIAFDVDETIGQNTTLASITALHVLRIVQEAVHNAIKHSGCSSIQIHISSQSPVIISIKDNGTGMPAEPVPGEGLKNMQARAADIGWNVTITNETKGCCVQLRNTK